MDQIARSVSQRTGVSQSQVAHIAFGANGSLGFGGIGASAKVQGSAGKAYQSGILSDEQKVLGAMSSEQLSAFKQFGERISRDSSFMRAIGSDGREASEMASRLATDTSNAQRTETAYAERKAVAERLTSAYERGEAISIDMAQDPHNMDMFMRYSERYGGNSAAAHTMMASELARQGLQPNRGFSDGSAVPQSFQHLRESHQESINKESLGQAVGIAHQHNDVEVAAKQSTRPSPVPSPGTANTNVRDQVQAQKQHLQHQGADIDARSPATSDVDRTQDGTLRSRKSLLTQSSKQVATDAEATLDAAKEAVKGLISRK